MERKNLNPKQVDQLLQAASKKLGVPPEQLKSELESGKYDKVLKNMSQKDSVPRRQRHCIRNFPESKF